MNSVELINKLKRIAPAWSRVSLLELIDSEQSQIFSGVSPILRVFDSVTGKDPLLTTVSGTSVYEIDVANGFSKDMWRIENVRTSTGTIIEISDGYADESTVRTMQAVGSASSRVIFNFDPGVETYYLECYTRPTRLASENTEISVPEEFIDVTLFEATAGSIEKLIHGSSNRYNDYLKNLLPPLLDAIRKETPVRAINGASDVTLFINSVMKKYGQYTRIEILHEINAMQETIYGSDNRLLPIYDTNGKSPILTTTAGTFEYSLVDTTPATFGFNVKSIVKVFTASGTIISATNDYGDSKTVVLIDKDGDDDAKIIFNFDPGIDTFYVECNEAVPLMINEDSLFTLPPEFVWTYLFEGVTARLAIQAEGINEQYLEFSRKGIPSLVKRLLAKIKMISLFGETSITMFIDKVLKESRSSTRKEIIDEINIVQREIFATTKYLNRISDSVTGKDPILTTGEGDFIYDLNVADFGYDVNTVEAVYDVSGDLFPDVMIRKATPGVPVKIIFTGETVPPGDFSIECYSKVVTVLNENSVLSIPDEYVYSHLYEGVVGRLTQYSKGGSNRLREFNSRLIPDLAWKLDKEYNHISIPVIQRGI